MMDHYKFGIASHVPITALFALKVACVWNVNHPSNLTKLTESATVEILAKTPQLSSMACALLGSIVMRIGLMVITTQSSPSTIQAIINARSVLSIHGVVMISPALLEENQQELIKVKITAKEICGGIQ